MWSFCAILVNWVWYFGGPPPCMGIWVQCWQIMLGIYVESTYSRTVFSTFSALSSFVMAAAAIFAPVHVAFFCFYPWLWLHSRDIIHRLFLVSSSMSLFILKSCLRRGHVSDEQGWILLRSFSRPTNNPYIPIGLQNQIWGNSKSVNWLLRQFQIQNQGRIETWNWCQSHTCKLGLNHLLWLPLFEWATYIPHQIHQYWTHSLTNFSGPLKFSTQFPNNAPKIPPFWVGHIITPPDSPILHWKSEPFEWATDV
jgi:hypothetical protein